MIIILHRDPLEASKMYQKRYLKYFIRSYVHYLIKGYEYHYERYWDLEIISNKTLQWLLKKPANFYYMLFLCHYLLGRYEKYYPDKVLKEEGIVVDYILHRTSLNRKLGKVEKIKRLPPINGYTLKDYCKYVKTHRKCYSIFLKDN
jgi:hypothetical protein